MCDTHPPNLPAPASPPCPLDLIPSNRTARNPEVLCRAQDVGFMFDACADESAGSHARGGFRWGATPSSQSVQVSIVCVIVSPSPFFAPPSSLCFAIRTFFAPRFPPAALLRSLIRALQLGNTQLCEQLRINQNVVDNTLALCKFKDGVAKQTDSHTLRNAFNDAWQKVHLQLRCEHVPKFLVSAAFRTINSQFEEWADASKHPELEAGHDPVEASIAAMQNLDITTIMQQPFALDCFERFLRSSLVDGETEGNKAEAADNAWTLVCLIQEVENFKISTPRTSARSVPRGFTCVTEAWSSLMARRPRPCWGATPRAPPSTRTTTTA